MAARRGVWALARFLHRNQLPGETEKNALAACQLRSSFQSPRTGDALRLLGKAFFSVSPALETHGAQKRARAHSPGPFQGYTRLSFTLSSYAACSRGEEPPGRAWRPANSFPVAHPSASAA